MPLDSPSEPVLDKPGAGIPAIERFAGKWILRLHTLRGRAGAETKLNAERDHINRLCASLSPEQAEARILIPRLRGIEDSSRYWSVWMTLEHLAIVNEQIARVIVSLSRGIVPEGEASTAAVKPSNGADEQARSRFEHSCDRLVRAAAKPANLHIGVRYPHPWFGPLDAAQWHAMAGMHMALHRAQIAAIIGHLKRDQQERPSSDS